MIYIDYGIKSDINKFVEGAKIEVMAFSHDVAASRCASQAIWMGWKVKASEKWHALQYQEV